MIYLVKRQVVNRDISASLAEGVVMVDDRDEISCELNIFNPLVYGFMESPRLHTELGGG